jgi:dTMP kinase
MSKGKLIVLEGIDGSGKETQTKRLFQALHGSSFPVRQISFPCYGTTAAGPLEMYLRGEFGSHAADVGPYAASTLYAIDRFASYKKGWGKFYEDGGWIVSDRYTTSNAVFQGSKLPAGEWAEYLDWLYDFEYNKIGLPAPDMVLYLDVPTEVSVKMLAHRKNKPGVQHDIHETDAAYLEKCRKNALDVAKYSNWTIIQGAKDGKMKSIDEIHNDILSALRPLMAA